MNAFSTLLREIRGSVPVEELSRKSGVAAASIYKAESSPNVRWKTVELAYREFIKDPEIHLKLLINWALEQSDNPALREKWQEQHDSRSADGNPEQETSSGFPNCLSQADKDLLMNFQQRFSESETTRKLTAAWMAVNP